MTAIAAETLLIPNLVDHEFSGSTGTVDVEDATTTDIVTMALTALRISRSKVSHSTVNTESLVKQDALPEITLNEVSQHDGPNDCWVIIYDRVYDVTKFLELHPAGCDVILDYAGCDATFAFHSTGHSNAAIGMLKKYAIGELPAKQKMYRRPSGGLRLSNMPA